MIQWNNLPVTCLFSYIFHVFYSLNISIWPISETWNTFGTSQYYRETYIWEIYLREAQKLTELKYKLNDSDSWRNILRLYAFDLGYRG